MPPSTVYLTYPAYYIVPFHYPNPVTGKAFTPDVGQVGAYHRPPGTPEQAEALRPIRKYFSRLQTLTAAEKARLAEALRNARALALATSMHDELVALWERSNASKEQLVKQLQDWCQRAEASDVGPLAEFSRRLRCYA